MLCCIMCAYCRFLGGCLDPQTHCYTLEVSFFSYTTTDPHTQAPYTEEACIPPHHTHTPLTPHTTHNTHHTHHSQHTTHTAHHSHRTPLTTHTTHNTPLTPHTTHNTPLTPHTTHNTPLTYLMHCTVGRASLVLGSYDRCTALYL